MPSLTLPGIAVCEAMAYLHVTLEDETDKLPFPNPFVVVSGDRRFLVGLWCGGGGNSTVFEGREVDVRGAIVRTCAIKMQRILTPARRARFRNEVRIHSRIDHVRVASFYGAGDWTPRERAYDVPWVAMDLGGQNLYRYVVNAGPLEPGLLRRVAMQATDAVASLHEHDIIHRDIKPANFVWAFPHATDDIKMIDFGIAKLRHEDLEGRKLEPYLTDTMEFVGPQSFASPELLQYGRDKKTVVDERSDLFQLGLLFWFLGTGRVLSGVPSPSYDPIGGQLRSLVLDLIQEDPQDRPGSAAEVMARIKEIKI